MSIKQLSVFVGNEKGSIADITEMLSNAGVNLRAMTVADTVDFGILRLIADDTSRALSVLKNEGIIAGVTDATAFAVPDEPGGLARVLRILSEGGVNTEYMYSLFARKDGKACIVVRTADCAKTEQILKDAGIEVIDGDGVKEL